MCTAGICKGNMRKQSPYTERSISPTVRTTNSGCGQIFAGIWLGANCRHRLIRSEAKYARKQQTALSKNTVGPSNRSGGKTRKGLSDTKEISLSIFFSKKKRDEWNRKFVFYSTKPDAILCFAYRKFPFVLQPN